MHKDEKSWKLRASTPFIYESEENVVHKFIHEKPSNKRNKPAKTTGTKNTKSPKAVKKFDNIASLKSQTFTPATKKRKAPISTFKSKTCNFDMEMEMAASPVAISHKYYEYITDANAKYNVNGMGAFRKFKPDVPTITCKPQVFDWNLNLQQNILHKPKDSSADLRYNGKHKPISPPPPPTPIPHSSRKEARKSANMENSQKTDCVKRFDDHLSPSTLGLIKKIIRNRSRNHTPSAKKRGSHSMNSDSESTLDGIYVNIPSTSREKPKNMRRVPQPETSSRDCRRPSIKRLKSPVKPSTNSKVFVPRVATLKKGPSVKNPLPPKASHANTKLGPPNAKKSSVVKERSTKDVKKKDRNIK